MITAAVWLIWFFAYDKGKGPTDLICLTAAAICLTIAINT